MQRAHVPSVAERFRASVAPLVVLGPPAVALGLSAAWVPFGPATLDLAMFACWFLTLAAAYWSSASVELLEAVRDPAEPARESPLDALDKLAIAGIGVFQLGGLATFIACLVVDLQAEVPRTNVSAFSVVAALGASVSALLVRRMIDRDALRLLDVLLDAEPFGPASREGAPVRMQGVVRDPTPVATPVGPAAFAITEDVEHTPGTDPNIVRGSLASDRTFFVESPQGSLELDARGVLWAPGERLTWGDRAESGRDHTVTVDYLPVGVSVTVAGALKRGTRPGVGALAPTPGSPVVLLRHGPEEDPLAVFREARRRRRMARAALLAVTALTAALAAAMMPALPPTRW